ncbi:hypothetical protein AGMMS50229_16720 [Campylobacterota bacterium]|nr:hypothetical protein AGMMS50229_16720 [Campylobacterota bacterium]
MIARACFASLCLLVLSVFAAESSPAADSPLRVGIVPYNSTAALMQTHKPLRDFLSQKLGRKVVLYSSKDHAHFFQETLNGRFDVVLTTGHFMPAMIKKGFEPLLCYRSRLEISVVVRKDSDIKTIEDLRDKTIGLPDYLSLFYIGGMQWLDSVGLAKHYNIVEQASHITAIMAVASKRIDAAITSIYPLRQASKETQEQVVALSLTTVSFPSILMLADKKLGDQTVKDIADAFLAFELSEAGRQFFVDTGYIGYRAVTNDDIKAFNEYAKLTEKILESRP